jgi:pimeloyl-ACP methyl ester carboxylesterase
MHAGVSKGKWALGGHSAGGFGATQYAGEFGDRIYAAVMHAGGWGSNLTESPLPVANIYGTLDDLSPGGYDRYRYLDTDPPPKGRGPLVNLKTSRFIAIEGANHYQVGDYGYQIPDQIPTISMEQQVAEFAKETVSFLEDVASGKISQKNTQYSETSSL